jgi:hypothetical protein
MPDAMNFFDYLGQFHVVAATEMCKDAQEHYKKLPAVVKETSWRLGLFERRKP